MEDHLCDFSLLLKSTLVNLFQLNDFGLSKLNEIEDSSSKVLDFIGIQRRVKKNPSRQTGILWRESLIYFAAAALRPAIRPKTVISAIAQVPTRLLP